MWEDKLIKEDGLTFDDILLVPQNSKLIPREVDLHTSLSRNISLNIPLVSAAMDKVTEANLAIALAREGGIGIIHKSMTIQEQAREIDRVKRSESGIIVEPIALTEDKKVKDALELMKHYHISGIPVVNHEKKLVGILTNRDIRFLEDIELRISEVMTSEHLITGKVGTTLEEAKKVLHHNRIEKLPLVDENYILKGLITIKDIEKVRQYPNACKDDNGRLRV
ncbi:MAG TPA: IMP dehydrogenase, partial [Atribacterota bacterium]|nr:IMP dehydrogenase [Atribacterota bacterium]